MEQPQTILIPSYSVILKEKSEDFFENELGQAIDDILTGLGVGSKQAIYRHLKNHYGIDQDEIHNQIEDFTKAIEQIFGSVAKLIEIKIIERLHVKFDDFSYSPKKEELDFVKYVYGLHEYLQLKLENPV
jgi:hypothetical protein